MNEEVYLFYKELDDLQEIIRIIDTNCINSFHKTTYLGYGIAEIYTGKSSLTNSFLAL